MISIEYLNKIPSIGRYLKNKSDVTVFLADKKLLSQEGLKLLLKKCEQEEEYELCSKILKHIK